MHNSKTKWFISFIVLTLMLTIVGSVNAQSNVLATLSVDSNNLTVGDVIPLTLHVTHPAGWRVIVPTLEKTWGDFEVRQQATPVITSNGDGTETTSQQIEVVRMRPGAVQTPAIRLSIADDQGNLQTVAIAPLTVVVRSVLVAGDTQLRDIKPQADLFTAQRVVWPLLIVAAVSLIGLIGYAIVRRRNRPASDKRTPRERALAELQARAVKHPQSAPELKAACVQIAACLRGYIAATTPVAACDLTTNELARQLNRTELPPDWSTHAIDVLRLCDSVKFACDSLELTTVHGLIDTVELLLEQYPAASSQAKPKNAKRNLKGAVA
jgi:hypothetical protein